MWKLLKVWQGNQCSIRPEIELVYYLLRTIASLKFLDDATASPWKFCLALARTMKEDAEENRRIAEAQRGELIRKCEGEREKLEERIEENRNTDTETGEAGISVSV